MVLWILFFAVMQLLPHPQPTHTQELSYLHFLTNFANTTAEDDYTLVMYEVSNQLLPPPQWLVPLPLQAAYNFMMYYN